VDVSKGHPLNYTWWRRRGGDGGYISVKITGAYIHVLIDTGATESLMNENTAKILKLKINPLINTAKYDLVSANGADIKIIGETKV